MATIEFGGERYSFNDASPIDLSIPLRFDGPQPNAFGVDGATARSLGDTRAGSSVNFEEYTFTPHCNGTHTECVGHITDERISVRQILCDALMPAVLVSVEPSASPNGDHVITGAQLRSLIGRNITESALILRTLPNDDSKTSRNYGGDNAPPYFAEEAMEFIVECGFDHLLVDVPSIDRMFDDGKLVNHRIFWNVEQGSREKNVRTRINSTITELIYVPGDVKDGRYLLNLQIAPFQADAAPSRPVLFHRVLESRL